MKPKQTDAKNNAVYSINYNDRESKYIITNKFQEYSKQSKQTWQLINLLTNHCKNKWHIIKQIDIDNITYLNSPDIANRFGDYFSSIGSTVVSGIKNIRHTLLTTHLRSPIVQHPSLCMHVHKMKYQTL